MIEKPENWNDYDLFRYSIVEANSSAGVMNTLTISDVTRADGREFTCIASNKFGSKALPVYLSVYGNLG